MKWKLLWISQVPGGANVAVGHEAGEPQVWGVLRGEEGLQEQHVQLLVVRQLLKAGEGVDVQQQQVRLAGAGIPWEMGQVSFLCLTRPFTVLRAMQYFTSGWLNKAE